MNYNNPWKHSIHKEFLSESRFNDILSLAEKELEYLDMFGFFTRTGHYVRYVKEDIIPEITLDLYKDYTETRVYKKPLKKLIHWSIHPEGFEYPEHIDNDSRIFTSVLYVTPKENKGTILCKNNSEHSTDHGRPTQPNEYEVVTPWAQNTLFSHASINGKTWHKYQAPSQRCTLNVFFVQEDLILPDRIDNKFLIDV